MTKSLIAISTLLMSMTVNSQTLGVKGIELNMDKETYSSKYNKKIYSDGSAQPPGEYNNPFTIAGSIGIGFGPDIKFGKDGKLGKITFFFKVNDYTQIKEAFNTKYPLKCTVSTVQNRYQQQFDQEECFFKNSQGDTLSLMKRLDRDTGMLLMESSSYSKQQQIDQSMKLNQAKKDI